MVVSWVKFIMGLSQSVINLILTLFVDTQKTIPKDSILMIDQNHLPRGVDNSYHVRTNVSIRSGIVWGISVHIVHKGQVFIFSIVYTWRGY